MKKPNLVGSSNYAEEGKSFNLTCELSIPVKNTTSGVIFKREGIILASGGYVDNNFLCPVVTDTNKYTCSKVSEYNLNLTILGNSITEMDQQSGWTCEFGFNGQTYLSNNLILNVSSKL